MNPIQRLLNHANVPLHESTALGAAVNFVMNAMGAANWDPATLNRAMTSASRRYGVDIEALDKSLEGRIREVSV